MKKRRKGFTFTELVVVIAIIGVLIAVLVPTIIGFVNKAKISSDLKDVTNINKIIELNSIEDDIELTTISEIKNLIDSHYNNSFSYVPRSASLGNHFVFNTSTKKIELISEKEWGEKVEEITSEKFSLLSNKSSELTNLKPNVIEAFGWTEVTPYILLDESGSKLTDIIKSIYQIVDKPSLDNFKNSVQNLSNKKLNNTIKNLLLNQLEKTAIFYSDGANPKILKTFDDKSAKNFSKTDIAIVFSKKENCTPTIILESALLGIPLSVLDIPEGVKSIETSAFADTGVNYVVLPSTIEKIGTGAFNSQSNVVQIVLKGNQDYENLANIFNESGLLAKEGSRIKTSLGNYSIKINQENNETTLITENSEYNINTILNTTKVNLLVNQIDDLNNLDEKNILDQADEFIQSMEEYDNLAFWEKMLIGLRPDWNEILFKFQRIKYPMFEHYMLSVTNLYEALNDEELVFAHLFDTEIFDDIRDLLLQYENNINLDHLMKIEKENTISDFVSLGDEFGTYYCDNPGIDYLILSFKGINLAKRITIYSEGVYGISISKSIKADDSLNKEYMARFGNEGSFPVVVGLDYVSKDAITNVEELIEKFDINFELYSYQNSAYEIFKPNRQTVRDGSLKVNPDTRKHYYIVDLTINDASKDHYKFVATTNQLINYEASIKFVIVPAINVETGASIKNNSSSKNVALTSNIIITTTGVDDEYWYDENGLLTYRSTSAFATTSETVDGGFTVGAGKVFYGNNYTIDGRGMIGPHSTSSNDKKFIRLNDGAEINNLNVLMQNIPEYDNYASNYTFSQACAVLYTTASATIRNCHIVGGLRGIRIINANGKTVNIIDSFFEGAMSNIEIYAGSGGPTAAAYINLENVSIRTANSAAVNSGGHGVAILWFPGSGGEGANNFDNIYFKENNTRIYSWMIKNDAKLAIKGAVNRVGVSIDDQTAESLIQRAIFLMNNQEFVCTGMIIPNGVPSIKDTYYTPKENLHITSTTFNKSSDEINVSGGKVVGYYTGYVEGSQDFIDYITETWGTKDGNPWNGRLDMSSNLKPIDQANQYQHHGLYKTTEISD